MADKLCPECNGKMRKNPNGTYSCSTCGAGFIPSDWTGEFTAASIIGIHQKKAPP